MVISRGRTAFDQGLQSASAHTQASFDRIAETEPQLHSFVTLTQERAKLDAERIDKAKAAGEKLGPLAGVNLAIKDNLCTKGIKTTCSSRMLEHFIPPTNPLLPKGFGRQGLCWWVKQTSMSSPWAAQRKPQHLVPLPIHGIPPGCRGKFRGSAAAVAAGQCDAALGSDTGGSIRQPASFCGVVGLKPTYGRVSRWGLVAFASSLDQVGPFGRTVADVAAVLQVIAGHDPFDATSLDLPVPNYLEALDQPIKGLRVGILKEAFGAGLNPEVEASVRGAASLMQSLGCTMVDVSCPRFKDGIATYYVIAPSEASANLARYDGVKYGQRHQAGESLGAMTALTRANCFGAEVQRRILIGTYALSAGYGDAYYRKAQQVRTLIREDFNRAFQQVDLLLTPTSPTTAFKPGEHSDNPIAMYLADLLTIPANLAGIPAISVPCGFDSNGLPIGLQLMAPVLEEARLLQVSHHYEQAAAVMKDRPEAALAIG